MALTTCEVMWLSQLLKELGLHNLTPIGVKCDNQAALSIAVNPVHHERTKHVEIDCHFVRDQVHQKQIAPEHVRTQNQLADIFTKGLPVAKHTELMAKMGVLSHSPHPS